MLIRGAQVDGQGADVRIRGARIDRVAPGLDPRDSEVVIEARGGALLPGLHDHHIHLLSLGASLASLRCGPPDVLDAPHLAQALGRALEAAGDDWVRGFGYHESVAGDLDADGLDLLAREAPVRIQHRSGALWIVNRKGLERLGLATGVPADAPPGVERDEAGRATGRLFRADEWMRERLGEPRPPDLAPVGELLARFGVTGVTDATPGNAEDELALFSAALEAGALQQSLRIMGTLALPDPRHPDIRRGAVKHVLDDAGILDPDALAARLREAHAAGRSTAIHCVTRAELLVALAAFDAAGALPGDRIEHASVTPPELAARLADRGLTVVTQPNFIRERGDAYRREVDARDQPWLYRCSGLLDAGVALGGGTDAPFGSPDPWLAMQAAVDRRSAAGACLAENEALSPERARDLFTTRPESPGGPVRRIAPGEPADLCLLDRSWAAARDSLTSEHVAATWRAGQLTFLAAGPRS